MGTRKRWTAEEVAMAVDMARQGFDGIRISEELERPISSVRQKLGAMRKAGIDVPRLPRKDLQITIDDIQRELANIDKRRKAAARRRKGGKK